MSLQLTPNEVVGYRIKPDWYSFNVVLVKKHGAQSKNAGQEYETVLAHCKNLNFAVEWLVSHATRMHGEDAQKEALAQTGELADVKALAGAIEKAQQEALKAVADLQARLESAGLTSPKKVVHFLNEPVAPEGADPLEGERAA